jgi:hypothetical protein
MASLSLVPSNIFLPRLTSIVLYYPIKLLPHVVRVVIVLLVT